MSQQTKDACVVLNVILTFPNKDLELDPNRYTGNEPRIMEALIQKGLAVRGGFLTDEGQKYFKSEEESRYTEKEMSGFTSMCDDSGDRARARRRYREYVQTCPRKVILSFSLEHNKFTGDPMRYCGDIDPLLIEHKFFNKEGYCTEKTISIVKKKNAVLREDFAY